MERRFFQRMIFKNPQNLLISNFLLLIVIGFLLLLLPVSTVEDVSPLDLLFTSTSAVCVTGLITVDTATAYSLFGKTVILLLIQLGGLGLMTFGALIFRITGTRLSYASSLTLQSTFFQQNYAAEFRGLFREIFLITAVIESCGIAGMMIFLPAHENIFQKFFSSVFHTVSAFCNAGFSIYSDSLMTIRNSIPLMSIFMLLIIFGGLGYFTLIEMLHRTRKKRFNVDKVKWSLNTRVIILMTVILLVGGTVLLFGTGLTGNENGFGEKFFNALFQSVTARTAGFNSLAIGGLPYASLMVLMILMFIGGSPGSTAGGVKTTTIAVMFTHLRSGLRGQDDVNLLERRLSYGVIRRAIVVIFLALIWNAIGVLILSITEAHNNYGFIGLLFEQISAFATVGLSTGVTPTLSVVGKIWIIISMFIGRLGPLAIALWFVDEQKTPVRFPKERVMIG